MFILTSNMFGLAILSLGILGVIVSLLISNRRRFLIGISLSGFLVVLGIFYVVDTSLRQWWTARSIAKLQAKNRETLDLLKNRNEATVPAVPLTVEERGNQTPAPAVPRPRRRS
ncbi:MAG: hypothetical protein IPP35_00680 [Elusimicrobia bacterium]|nr:hypothetical protein [Elusimicrobiota bacterium]